MKTFGDLTREDCLHCMTYNGTYHKFKIKDIFIDEEDNILWIDYFDMKGNKRRLTVKGNESKEYISHYKLKPYEPIRLISSCKEDIIKEFEEEIAMIKHQLKIYEDNLKCILNQ